MWWTKYKCGKCGKEFKWAEYRIREKRKEIILCGDCFKKWEEEYEDPFGSEKRKKSIAHFYEGSATEKFNYGKKKKEINLKFNIYSNKRLTKEERDSFITSYIESNLRSLSGQIISAEKGDKINSYEFIRYLEPIIEDSKKRNLNPTEDIVGKDVLRKFEKSDKSFEKIKINKDKMKVLVKEGERRRKEIKELSEKEEVIRIIIETFKD